MFRKNKLILVLMLLSGCVFGQFQYTEFDELKSFSYLSEKIIETKNEERINTLTLPSFNNDSLGFVMNITKYTSGHTYIGNTSCIGINIDTIINFFDVATRFKVKEGYVWLYRIYSPTAKSLGFKYESIYLNKNEYLSIHSNFHDSLNGPYEFQLPEVLLQLTNKTEFGIYSFCEENCYARLIGNSFYIEYFSKRKKRNKRQLRISKIIYGFGNGTTWNKKTAPKWLKEKYPNATILSN